MFYLTASLNVSKHLAAPSIASICAIRSCIFAADPIACSYCRNARYVQIGKDYKSHIQHIFSFTFHLQLSSNFSTSYSSSQLTSISFFLL